MRSESNIRRLDRFLSHTLHAGLEKFDSDPVYVEMAAHSIWAGAPVQAFNGRSRGARAPVKKIPYNDFGGTKRIDRPQLTRWIALATCRSASDLL